MQQPMKTWDFHPGYAYGAHSYKTPSYFNKQAIFVHSPAISSRLITQNEVYTLTNSNSGKMVIGSNMGAAMNQRSFREQPPVVNDLNFLMQTANSRRVLNAHLKQSPETIPSLNKLASSLPSNAPVSMKHFQQTPHQRSRFTGLQEIPEERYGQVKNSKLPYSNGKLINSPPRENLAEPVGSKITYNNSVRFANQDKPLRKRIRSETSSESYESRPSKFQRTSEDSVAAGMRGIKQENAQVTRCRRPQPAKSSVSQYLAERDKYDMQRLDLGPSIGNSGAQQELLSRLKAINYSSKVMTEDLAIVVPSLPSILSLPSPQ